MSMEVHINIVKAKSQEVTYEYKIWWQNRKAKTERKSAAVLKIYTFCHKIQQASLRSRRERCWGYLSICENTPEKLLHLPPKSCHNFT